MTVSGQHTRRPPFTRRARAPSTIFIPTAQSATTNLLLILPYESAYGMHHAWPYRSTTCGNQPPKGCYTPVQQRGDGACASPRPILQGRAPSEEEHFYTYEECAIFPRADMQSTINNAIDCSSAKNTVVSSCAGVTYCKKEQIPRGAVIGRTHKNPPIPRNAGTLQYSYCADRDSRSITLVTVQRKTTPRGGDVYPQVCTGVPSTTDANKKIKHL